MARTFYLKAACHCSAVTIPVNPLDSDALAYDYRATESHPRSVEICHCNSCRHSTGGLCTSYYPNQRPLLEHTASFPFLEPNRVPGEVHRFFRTRCGCHMFKAVPDKERARWSDGAEGVKKETLWGVATGTLEVISGKVAFYDHIFVDDAKDGGAAS